MNYKGKQVPDVEYPSRQSQCQLWRSASIIAIIPDWECQAAVLTVKCNRWSNQDRLKRHKVLRLDLVKRRKSQVVLTRLPLNDFVKRRFCFNEARVFHVLSRRPSQVRYNLLKAWACHVRFWPAPVLVTQLWWQLILVLWYKLWKTFVIQLDKSIKADQIVPPVDVS